MVQPEMARPSVSNHGHLHRILELGNTEWLNMKTTTSHADILLVIYGPEEVFEHSRFVKVQWHVHKQFRERVLGLHTCLGELLQAIPKGSAQLN